MNAEQITPNTDIAKINVEEGGIVLFAYDFPHRKTHDFIVDLIVAGIRKLIVIAAPMKELSHQDGRQYFDKDLRFPLPKKARDLCNSFDIPYYCVEHEDVDQIKFIKDNHGCDIGIVSGARIIPREVIACFSSGIINFHPGKIPETSGLDSFFYTIKHNAPAGVTTHFIDHKVDAGRIVDFHELQISPSSDPQIIQENLHQLQRIALQGVVEKIRNGNLLGEPIDRPHKNLPMTPEEKIDAVAKFPRWRAFQVIRQESDHLFKACESGGLSRVQQIINEFPDFLHQSNSKGWTPLIVAAFHQQEAIVDFLIRSGANPNDTGINGTTVLMYAKTKLLHVATASYDLLEYLIASGADCFRTDCHGKNVLHYVLEQGDSRLEMFFRAKMNECNISA